MQELFSLSSKNICRDARGPDKRTAFLPSFCQVHLLRGESGASSGRGRQIAVPTDAVHLDGEPVRYGCGGFRRTSEARPYVLLLPIACSLLPAIRFAGCRGHRPLRVRRISTGNPSATGAADFDGEPVRYGCGGFRRGTRPLRVRRISAGEQCLPLRSPIAYCLLCATRFAGRRGRRPLRVRCIWTGNPSATGAADFGGEPARYGCGGFRRASNACPYVLLLPVPYCLPSALRAVGDARPYGCGAFGRGTRPLRVRRISTGEQCSPLRSPVAYCLFPIACHPLCGPSGTPAPTGAADFGGRAMLAPTFSCCLLPIPYCLPSALRAVGDAGPYGVGWGCCCRGRRPRRPGIRYECIRREANL